MGPPQQRCTSDGQGALAQMLDHPAKCRSVAAAECTAVSPTCPPKRSRPLPSPNQRPGRKTHWPDTSSRHLRFTAACTKGRWKA